MQACGMICIIYVVCAALFIGLLVWALKDSAMVAWVSFGVFIVYLIIIVVMVYYGSAERKKKERDFINAKIREQREEKVRMKKENEEYQEFLTKYMR